MENYRIISVGADAKTVKGEKRGTLTGILYLAPADELAGVNNCPHASPGCRAACLFTAGMGAMGNVRSARMAKTARFYMDRDGFLADLRRDLTTLVSEAKKQKMVPACRLNGTSDLPWEKIAPTLFTDFPTVVWYDYTKNPVRMRKFLAGKLPSNYSLTFSRSETNDRLSGNILREGGNVAVVFSGRQLPKRYKGVPVINGDVDDRRFADKRGRWVGLLAKGKAKKDKSGFVITL